MESYYFSLIEQPMALVIAGSGDSPAKNLSPASLR